MRLGIKISAAIVLVLAIAVFTFTKSTSIMVVNTKDLPQVDLSFSVVGDVHGNTGKFQEVIQDLYQIRPNMDLMVLNGDAVDQGLEKQYDSMKNIINKNKRFLPDTIIKNIGNHEFFDYDKEYNTDEDVKTFIGRYLDFAEEEKVYHDKWINGYHFISLGYETGHTKEHNSVSAYISKDQLNWFKEKIAEKNEKGKPIFVFLHQHLSSSNKGWVGTEQAEEIKKILSQYPVAILFTSHTHASLETTNVSTKLPYTTVHTGAVHYTLKTGSDGTRERTDDLFAIYVEVNENKVTIKGRDFRKDTWIFEKEI